MSLSKEALELIIANAVAASGELGTATPSLLLPEQFKVESLERLHAKRSRFRGSMTTSSITDFVQYVKSHDQGQSGAAGFVDQEKMEAIVIFNLGSQASPGHGDDTAVLKVKETAAYSALRQIADKALTQLELAEWLEDWAPHLSAYADTDPLQMPAAINGIRRMTVKATAQRDTVLNELNTRLSVMDEIEACSHQILPTGFTFNCVPFEGLQPADIKLRLSIITSSDKLTLKLRWIGKEAQCEHLAYEFKGCLDGKLGSVVPLTLGRFSLND